MPLPDFTPTELALSYSEAPLQLLRLADELNAEQLGLEACGEADAARRWLDALNIANSYSDSAQAILSARLGVAPDYKDNDATSLGALAARLDSGAADEADILLALGLIADVGF